MSRRTRWINEAMKAAKIKYGGLCIVTGNPHPDAAHIFTRGAYPELAAIVCNIVPLDREVHIAMDAKTTNGYERIEWLNPLVLPEIRGEWYKQQNELLKIKGEHNERTS